MVAGLVAALLAPVTGGLFGLAYGTAIRIGYEQIYPALFPNKGPAGLTTGKKDVIAGLVQMYDIIGGKGAHEFGINIGIQSAMKASGEELFKSPELNQAVAIEAGISGFGVSGGRQGLTDIQFSQLGKVSEGQQALPLQSEAQLEAIKSLQQLIFDVDLRSQQARDAVEKALFEAEKKELEEAKLAALAAAEKSLRDKDNITRQALIDAKASISTSSGGTQGQLGVGAKLTGQFQPTGGSPIAVQQKQLAKLQAEYTYVSNTATGGRGTTKQTQAARRAELTRLQNLIVKKKTEIALIVTRRR